MKKSDKKPAVDTRRGFIKKSATAAAAVTAVNQFKTPVYGASHGPSTGRVIGANDRINCAVVGVGSQGFNAHVSNLVRFAGDRNVELIAVGDVCKHRLAEAADHVNKSGVECKSYAEHERIIERKDIDVVFCATVDHWHKQITVDALNAGKHVYCEKPMTRYLGEAFEVYDAAKASGKKVQVGAQRTTAGPYHKAAEIIRNGGIGPLVLGQASYMRNSPKGEWNYDIDPRITEDDIDWKRWMGSVHKKVPFDADHFRRWRKYYPYCGGVLGDLLPHRLHPFMLATGNPQFPSRVVSLGNSNIQTDKNTPGTYMRSVDENVQLIAEFPDGFNLFLTSGTVNEQGLPEMIRGQHGTISLGGNRVQIKPERPFSEEVDPEEFENLLPNESVPNHHANFFDAIRNDVEPSAGIDLAVKAQTVVSLAEMSDRLNIMCLFDEKTRKVTTANGVEVEPITYGSLELS
jgi:predicted dehydrogenase